MTIVLFQEEEEDDDEGTAALGGVAKITGTRMMTKLPQMFIAEAAKTDKVRLTEITTHFLNNILVIFRRLTYLPILEFVPLRSEKANINRGRTKTCGFRPSDLIHLWTVGVIFCFLSLLMEKGAVGSRMSLMTV